MLNEKKNEILQQVIAKKLVLKSIPIIYKKTVAKEVVSYCCLLSKINIALCE